MIRKNKTDNLDGESPIYDENYNKKQFKSKNQADIIKSIVEIIKNGVDAYLEEKEEENCNSEPIDVFLNMKEKVVKIINYAEGMDLKTFRKALKIGGDTGSEKESKTGAHGYGMKEAAWAFNHTTIISIKDGRYSSRIFYWDNDGAPKYAWDKDKEGNELKDVKVTDNIRKETKINFNGTYFEGLIPKDIRAPTFDTLWKELSWHVLLRSINQSPKFDVRLRDDSNKRVFLRSITYVTPDILKLREDGDYIKKGDFTFEYLKYGKIICEYKIYLATHELNPFGDGREAGILICAGPFSVLDCTLFNQGGKIANRFFGKAILKGPLRSITKKERILDDRRASGLLKNTPLYVNLSGHFNQILEELIEKERKRLSKNVKDTDKGTLSDKNKLLKALNKIANDDEKTDLEGDEKFEPGPNGIRFCISGNYEKLIEDQKKNIHLVIDTQKIPLGSKIKIKSDKEGLDISPREIEIQKKGVDKNGVFKIKIAFSSRVLEEFLATAFVEGFVNRAELNLEVNKDERLYIETPLEFFPSEQDIVTGNSKKVSLILDKSKIEKNRKLELIPDKIFTLNKKISLKDAEKIKGSIYELIIPIHCSGKPNNNGKIRAKIGNVEAVLNLEVIKPQDKHLKGPFKDIKDDDEKDPEESGYFENKVIYIFINHAILKYYRQKYGGEKSLPYRVLYADFIVREALKELTRRKIKIFSNTGAEEYRVRFNKRFNELYKKNSTSLHKFCVDPANLELLRKQNEN